MINIKTLEASGNGKNKQVSSGGLEERFTMRSNLGIGHTL